MQRAERCKQFCGLMVGLGVTLIVGVTCAAQEVGFIDLTGIEARTEFRRSLSQESNTSRTGSSTRELQDWGPAVNGAPALRTTLLWLDRNEYQVGDEEKFAVQIENVGSQPISIPFSPHVADLQPENPGQHFGYSTLTIVLWLGGELWSESQASGSEIALYGSDGHPDTMLTLRPGEWVQVVGKGKLTLSDNVLPLIQKGDAVSYANANVSIYGLETKLSATASATVAHGICLIESQGPNVAVQVNAPKVSTLGARSGR
jgi:hypothetical protein